MLSHSFYLLHFPLFFLIFLTYLESTKGRGRGRNAARVAAAQISASKSVSPVESPRNGGSSFFSSSSSTSTASFILDDTYWMVGFDQLLREERHQACINIVTDQLEQLSGIIAQIMCENSMNQEMGSHPSKSSSISLTDLYAKIKLHFNKIKKENELAKTLGNPVVSTLSEVPQIHTIDKLLDFMRYSPLNAISKVEGSEVEPNGPYYCLNYDSIISFLRRRVIHQIAVTR